MKTTKKWWVYVETGECAQTRTVEGAIELLQPFYPGIKLTPENVVPEEVANDMLRAEQEVCR
jgi:hypothetical protein